MEEKPFYIVKYARGMRHGFRLMNIDEFETFGLCLTHLCSEFDAVGRQIVMIDVDGELDIITPTEFRECFTATELTYSEWAAVASAFDGATKWGVFAPVDTMLQLYLDTDD